MFRKLRMRIKFLIHRIRKLFPYKERFFLSNYEVFINFGDVKYITEDNIRNRIYIGHYSLYKCNVLRNIINITSKDIIRGFSNHSTNTNERLQYIACFNLCNDGKHLQAIGGLIKYKIKDHVLYTWHKYRDI